MDWKRPLLCLSLSSTCRHGGYIDVSFSQPAVVCVVLLYLENIQNELSLLTFGQKWLSLMMLIYNSLIVVVLCRSVMTCFAPGGVSFMISIFFQKLNQQEGICFLCSDQIWNGLICSPMPRERGSSNRNCYILGTSFPARRKEEAGTEDGWSPSLPHRWSNTEEVSSFMHLSHHIVYHLIQWGHFNVRRFNFFLPFTVVFSYILVCTFSHTIYKYIHVCSFNVSCDDCSF